jgi:hypothetical protein
MNLVNTKKDKKLFEKFTEKEIKNMKDSNIYKFIEKTNPQYELSKENTLKDLWDFYDQPYGLEVEMTLNETEERVYYVPQLSALQITYDDKKIEYFEVLNPELRQPLTDTMEEIYENKTDIYDLKIEKIDKESWFCISWTPILYNHKTIKYIQGSLLTYHEFGQYNIIKTEEKEIVIK